MSECLVDAFGRACVCITYSREAWIEGPAGGMGGIAREMREV